MSFIGFCVTRNFIGENFAINLIHAGFAAAMVGGLADWFAITAFFQKIFVFPHTDIIRAEREQLIQSIADFFTDDVLNEENLKAKIKSEDIKPSQMLIEYLNKFHGKEKISEFVRLTVSKLLNRLDLQEIVKKLEPDLKNFLREGAKEKNIPKLISKMIASRHAINFYTAVLKLAEKILQQPSFQNILRENISEMTKRYDEDNVLRELFRKFGLSDEDILNLITEQGGEKLSEMERYPEPSFGKIKGKVDEFINSPQFLEKLENAKNSLLDRTDLADWIYNKLDNYRRMNKVEILNKVEELTNRLTENFCNKPEWQKVFDGFVKSNVNDLIGENHEMLREKIKEALLAKPEDEIVKMVQDGAGDSAHAIRISGSLVGAIAGMILYVVGNFAEGFLK